MSQAQLLDDLLLAAARLVAGDSNQPAKIRVALRRELDPLERRMAAKDLPVSGDF